MLDLSPDLKIGITLAILNCIGTIPVLKERVKICNKGSTKVEMVCFTKFEETPVWSGVFLFVKSLVAFRISFLVKFLPPSSNSIAWIRANLADSWGKLVRKLLNMSGVNWVSGPINRENWGSFNKVCISLILLITFFKFQNCRI